MLELLHYQFFIHALAAALFASISCGIIGTYIVSRRMVFISGGITHAAFGGIGVAHYLRLDPVLGAGIFATLSGLGIEWATKHADIREDSAIGIFWSFGMALGIIFIYLTPGYAPDLSNYLFGSILTVSRADIYAMAILCAAIIFFFALLFKEILALSFDEEYLKTQRVPCAWINYMLIALVALTVVVNIRVVGIILVISLLTIPQAIAGIFSRNFVTIMQLSIGFSLLASLTGLGVSYALQIPSGACIIFACVVFFAFAKVLNMLYLAVKIRRDLKENNPNEE